MTRIAPGLVTRRTFTGAWIETRSAMEQVEASSGRTFTGAWIETDPGNINQIIQPRRTFTGILHYTNFAM